MGRPRYTFAEYWACTSHGPGSGALLASIDYQLGIDEFYDAAGVA
jgi:hypothetical protein